MGSGDRIWGEIDDIYQQWGLSQIPFSESAPADAAGLDEIFTGRDDELRSVLHLFHGTERKRILVYGAVGIGKSAFILEVLGILRRNLKDAIIAYISLPPETDLATASLIALAREMESYDEWAQHQLHQMGMPTTKGVHKTKEKLNAGFDGGIPGVVAIRTGGDRETESVPYVRPAYPTLAFEDLLKRAAASKRRVVLGIDDLDKQDPAKVRKLIHDAQGLLKGHAWFILSGHPHDLTRDLVTMERGFFDLALGLSRLPLDTMYQMLINYLNSARSKKRKSGDPRAVHPFTETTARLLCERSQGVPRWLNRLGSYVLLKAAELKAETITEDVLQAGHEYMNQQARSLLGDGLTEEEVYLVNLLLERGTLSDATVTTSDLERLKMQEFSEILPILDGLVSRDLLQRLPSENEAEYRPTPLLLPGK